MLITGGLAYSKELYVNDLCDYIYVVPTHMAMIITSYQA